MKNKPVILFDMDGVLINTEPLHFRIWQQIMEKRGVALEFEPYKCCIGSTIGTFYDMLEREYGKDLHGDTSLVDEFCRIKNGVVMSEGVPGIEYIDEVIPYLYKCGYRMAVASSSPQSHIEAELEKIHISKYFELLFSAENVPNPKPAPDVFIAVVKRLGVHPSDCLVIEDSYNGVTAAKAAGMMCYAFQNPDSGSQDLSAADKIFYPMRQLKKLLI